MNKAQVLGRIEMIYCPLTDGLKQEWAEKSKLLTLKRGHVLAREDERSTKLWFVVSGDIRAFYTKGGKRICDWFAFENDFICAIYSFYSDRPSMHQIDLLSDGILLETSKKDIDDMCDKYPELDRLGRLSATATMMALQEKIVSIQFETAQKRLEKLLVKHPGIYQKVSLGDIASYIGITQETLSRIRASPARI